MVIPPPVTGGWITIFNVPRRLDFLRRAKYANKSYFYVLVGVMI